AVRLNDMWGFAESQETTCVSPACFAEFIFPYQLKILERFGLNCYGCCEPLERRWDNISRIPRLRRVSVSPWSDREAMAEKLGGDYIYSMKPNPADLATREVDWDRVRRQLRDDVRKAQGCKLEIVMKDNHTLGGNPSNVVQWCRMAGEVTEDMNFAQ
ncbi:MAG: hypothetical protein PHT33_04000, partial [bacterium]|nr:hypothetical protein [bacterium]